MRRIGFILFICVGVGLVAGLRSRTPQTTAQSPEEPGSLKWYAEIAKAKGKKQITFDAGFENYAVARSLAEAVPYYSLVKVSLIDSVPRILDEKQIETWWRFRVVEILSEQQIVNCDRCPPLRMPPLALGTPLQGQLLIPKKGGAATIDGVTVISSDHQLPDFEPTHEYLLFVSLDDSKTVGNLGMGPAGVYGLKPDGTLQHLDNRPYEIWSEIESKYGASVERLRSHLRK